MSKDQNRIRQTNVRQTSSHPNPVTGKTVFKPGTSSSGCLDAWVFSLTLAGQCDYQLQNGSTPADTLVLQARQVLVIRPGVTQHWQVPMHAAGWTVIWATFNPRPHWLDWLDWPGDSRTANQVAGQVASHVSTKTHHGYDHLTLNDAVAARHARLSLDRMHRFGSQGARFGRALALNALEEALLWCQDEQLRQRESMDARVTLALRHLAEHLHEPVSLCSLAQVCHTSRARLAALFMRDVGVPPMRYLEQQRMARACELLEMTPLQIKQIARQVGYDDPHHFSKRFVAMYQQSPSDYRHSRHSRQSHHASKIHRPQSQ